MSTSGSGCKYRLRLKASIREQTQRRSRVQGREQHQDHSDIPAPPRTFLGTMDLKLVMGTKKRGDGDATVTVKLVAEVEGDDYPACQQSKIFYLICNGHSKYE